MTTIVSRNYTTVQTNGEGRIFEIVALRLSSVDAIRQSVTVAFWITEHAYAHF